ncbi:MAG: hypothetical protein ABJA11_06805 [Pseudolysinimonas sp.]
MTITAPDTTTTVRGVPTVLRVASVLAALLAVVDVIGTLPYLGNPMPIEIGVAVMAIAALTIIGSIFAFLGRAWGVWVAAVTRFLSIGLMLPVFLEPDAPADAVLPATIQIVVTVIVIVLLLVGLRKHR